MATKNKHQAWLLSDSANVIETFGLLTVSDCQQLKKWLSATPNIKNAYAIVLEDVRSQLALSALRWNEEEFKMRFVSMVFLAADLTVPKQIELFYERVLEGIMQNEPISLKCDCLVATPTEGGRPARPYFFFQEFKKAKSDNYDPEAQMLVAMLLAQMKNEDQKPIYGAWQQGLYWYFAVLNGKEYCVSQPYNAGDAQVLHQIVGFLQALKQLILNR
jgi:hypothetical protein